jgi:hypothetical protein
LSRCAIVCHHAFAITEKGTSAEHHEIMLGACDKRNDDKTYPTAGYLRPRFFKR